METSRCDERHENGEPWFYRILGRYTHETHGFQKWQAGTLSIIHESNEARVVSHVDDPLICAKPATLEKFWTQITRLVVIKRGEAFNPHIPVAYLGSEYQSVHESGRRGFTVKPTNKYLDECLDILQLRNAKTVLTPLTELKSTNLHDETTMCVQAQHTAFRAIVGKLQYITGVRPDLMFATKCLSYKLGSPTLADLTRAKKGLRYLKGTRDMKLYLTIPAVKPNDLSKTLKHMMGYSDADWAGDPTTWKSASCTWCYVDQFLLTSECRGQGTVALSSGELELFALGALSAELIFAQAIMKEIGLSFPIHARAYSSTARAVATKHGASRKMKHIHTRFLFIQDLIFRKLLTISAIKTDVNPSDIETKALGRERFYKMRSMLSMGTELPETNSLGKWYNGDEWHCKSLETRWWSGRVEWSMQLSKLRFYKFFSVKRGTPREPDTASRREEAC